MAADEQRAADVAIEEAYPDRIWPGRGVMHATGGAGGALEGEWFRNSSVGRPHCGTAALLFLTAFI